MKRAAGNVVLAFGSVIVAALLCEALLRAVAFTQSLAQALYPAWPWIIYDPVLGRRNQPGFVSDSFGFHINSLGFKGPEIERQKPPQTFRIICLGDSTTFGIWKESQFVIRAHTSYPEVLGKLSEADGIENVEVVNAGVLGYTTANGLRQLLATLLRLSPDIVTLRFGNNDHALERGELLSPLATDFAYHVMRWFPLTVYDWQLVQLGFYWQQRYATRRPVSRAERLVSLDAFERNLRRFVTIGHERGFQVLFLDYPYRALEDRTPPIMPFPEFYTGARNLREMHEIHDTYQRVVQKVATETKTPMLHTVEQFRQSPVPVFTDYDVVHPNEAGITRLAQLLFEKLKTLGIGASARGGPDGMSARAALGPGWPSSVP